jgi:carboxyl-terminal processing protease
MLTSIEMAMHKYRILRSSLWLAFLCACLSLPSYADTNSVAASHELRPGPDDGRIAYITARLLEQGHYTRHPFDSEVSSKMLDLYLKTLDPQHMLFLQSDLAKFEPYRHHLNTLTLNRGDTWPAYEIFNTFLERLEQQVSYVNDLLKAGNFTFTNDDRVLINRKDQPAPKDPDEAKQVWRERLRFEYLQEILARSGEKKKAEMAGKSGGTNGVAAKATPKTEDQEISELLSKRYHRNLHIFEEMDHDDVFEIYLNSLARVYDPHTDYFGKSQLEQFAISMNLALFGIGAQLRVDDDGYCVIDRLLPGGPAIKSKAITEKERIVAVAQSNGPPVDIVGMNLNKAVQLVRGPKGSEVRLTLESPDTAARHVVSLIRDEIPLEDQQAKAKIIDLPGPNGETNRVGVIDLPSFYASFEGLPGSDKTGTHHFTSKDVAELIKKMKEQNVHGIILDLRRNGGGSLEEAIKLTGLFIKEGPVVQVRGPEGKPMVDSDDDPSILWDGPLVVLTSRFSASASEIVAAALQDYGRALIVGDISTHGKGTVQNINQLSAIPQLARLASTNDPGALKLTIRKFYRANGASTQFEGVKPDIVLPSVLNYAKDVGEKSLDYALPWDTIPSAKFDKVDRVAPYVAELKKDSDERIAKSKDFEYVREDIAQFVKRQEDKTMSLNEKVRLNEKAADDARQKARDKERLARKGREPVVYDISLKQAELPGLPKPTLKTNSLASAGSRTGLPTGHPTAGAGVGSLGGTSDDADEEKPPAIDPTLDESESILVDYMHVLDRGIAAKK